MNIQDWFPLGLTDLISLQSKGLSRVFSSTTIWKHQFSSTQPSQSAKNLPAVQETWVQSLGWEDPLEKEMATHSSILAWKISWTEEAGGLQSMGSQRVGDNWATNTQHTAFFMVQLSHPYMTTGESIALTLQTLSAKWYLCFLNMLSRFVIAFLARSKHLLISWLLSLSTLILEPRN